MSLLVYNDLIKKIEEKLNSDCEELDIITAFCKLETLKYIDKCAPGMVEKKLIVRFRFDDLVNGSTDKEIYHYCKEHNWKIYINLDLHAKIYVIDDTCYIGSANTTDRGLSISKLGNIEISKEFQLSFDEKEQINKLFSSSRELNDELYNKMIVQLESIALKRIPKYKWNDSIIREYNQSYDLLFQEDFPINEDPLHLEENEKYLEIFKNDSFKHIKEKFEDTKIFKWLISILQENKNNEVYFGELSEKIHSIIFQEPKQYRKNVKELQKKLLSWLKVLDYEYIVIDEPNYSTRIKLIKNF